MIKLKISFIANALIYYTWMGQKLSCNEKLMSQIKSNPVTDFRYETKVGFSFIVGEAIPLAPILGFSGGKIEGWWHIHVFDVSVQIPHQWQEYIFF